MITLTRKLKKSSDDNHYSKNMTKRVSIRDRLLVKEVQEMESMLPNTCSLKFSDPHKLHDFYLIVCPDEGFWHGGKFWFHIYITEEYNMAASIVKFIFGTRFEISDYATSYSLSAKPPTVKCETKLWHPNISEEGEICLSLLRQNSIDGLGWAPTRRLKDVIWGLNSLFTDLLNFEDPLNISAAELYVKDREAFKTKVHDYILQYSRS